MLSAARLEVRKNFENNRGLATGSEEYSKQITHAEEIAKFLRENVVQGEAKEAEGSYSMFRSACGFAEIDVAIANAVYQSSISTSIPSAGTTKTLRKERGIH